jgi:hypothetical protein
MAISILTLSVAMRHPEVNSRQLGTDEKLLAYRPSLDRTAPGDGIAVFDRVGHLTGIRFFKKLSETRDEFLLLRRTASLHVFQLDDITSEPDRKKDVEIGGVY